MNKNLILMSVAAVMMFSAARAEEVPQKNRDALRERIIAENRAQNEALETAHQERLNRRAQGLPTNPDETPISAKIIYHDSDVIIKGRRYDIEKARVWFTDEYSHPCYRTVAEHFEKNPDFQDVDLVLYKKGWIADSFEKMGTVADENARKQFKAVLAEREGWLLPGDKRGGLWCPLENVFIGGTRDVTVCEAYARCLTKEQKIELLKKQIDVQEKRLNTNEKRIEEHKKRSEILEEERKEQLENIKIWFDKISEAT
jgi:hypothetical protein